MTLPGVLILLAFIIVFEMAVYKLGVDSRDNNDWRWGKSVDKIGFPRKRARTD